MSGKYAGKRKLTKAEAFMAGVEYWAKGYSYEILAYKIREMRPKRARLVTDGWFAAQEKLTPVFGPRAPVYPRPKFDA